MGIGSETKRKWPISQDAYVTCAVEIQPVAIINGYHVWKCVTHHRPLDSCIIENLRAQVIKLKSRLHEL